MEFREQNIAVSTVDTERLLIVSEERDVADGQRR